MFVRLERNEWISIVKKEDIFKNVNHEFKIFIFQQEKWDIVLYVYLTAILFVVKNMLHRIQRCYDKHNFFY